ncbi:MAG: RluA family pseudouridine synthase [Gammaproteobacteria bacterium]|nr:RluA family pseudouridine synthase [Gammaproteobacteria bacterium]
MRADHWLRQRYPSLTRRHVAEALEHGLVRASGGRLLARGDVIDADNSPDCTRLERHLELLRGGNAGLDIPILLESDDVVAVDKPPGLPSHPISLFDVATVTGWATARYPEIMEWAPDCQPTVTPHRLDNDTSGVLLVARTRVAFESWRRRFAAKQVTKRYLAWCWGARPSGIRVIDCGIAHDPRDERKMIAIKSADTPYRGRVHRASTSIRTECELADRFLCEITIQTGVTHQIRVHMASLGNPLVGDRLYDPQAKHRTGQPEKTLLRCIELRCQAYSAEAGADDFRRMY